MSKDFDKAFLFVANAHLGATRKKTGLPYFVHCCAVLERIACWGVIDSDIRLAAVAHDVLEDCPDVDPNSLLEHIGPKAFSIVQELTFTPTSLENKSQEKIDYINSFANKSIESLLIKIADRLCNIWDFYHTDITYAFKYYCKGKQLYTLIQSRKNEIDPKMFELIERDWIEMLHVLNQMFYKMLLIQKS